MILRVGVGKRKNDRVCGHLGHHRGFEYAGSRKAQEHVCAPDHFRQAAQVRLSCVLRFVLVHQFGAAFVDDTGQVRHVDVLSFQSQLDEQIQASQRRGSRA